MTLGCHFFLTDFDLLQTIPGIDEIGAALILIEIGDRQRLIRRPNQEILPTVVPCNTPLHPGPAYPWHPPCTTTLTCTQTTRSPQINTEALN